MLSLAVLVVTVSSVLGGPCEPGSLSAPIDLTHPLGVHSHPWPGARPFEFTLEVDDEHSEDGGFLAYKEFCLAEHLGTHLDAPYHFNKSNWRVGDIPLSHLIAPGVLIDASEAAAANRDLYLGVDALNAWEAEHGRVSAGSVALLRFGWARKYNDRADYFGSPSKNDTHGLNFPGCSGELAKALVERGIVGVGLDTPSIDPGKAGDKEPQAHRAFCNANIFILENVDLTTDKLPPKGFTIAALPAKIQRGTGAPVRIVALP